MLQNTEHTHSDFYIHQYPNDVMKNSLAQEFVLGLTRTTQSWSILTIMGENDQTFLKAISTNNGPKIKVNSVLKSLRLTL